MFVTCRSVTKRSHSDRSIRGYFNEVCYLLIINDYNKQLNYCSEFVGGTRCAKKSFRVFLDADVQHGLSVGHLDGTIMLFVR